MKAFHKIIIAAGLIIITALIIYFVWQKIAGPPNKTEEPPLNGTGTSTPPALKLKKLSDQSIFDFWVVQDTSEIYYLTPEGKILAAKEQTDLEISTQTINALNFIDVAPNNQKVLAAFGDPHQPQWGIFDVIDRVWRPLPAEILNATWGASGDELIVLAKNQTDINLALADLTKTPPTYKTILKDFRLKDIRLTFKPPQYLFISELPTALYAGRVWQLDLKTLAFDLIFAPEKGLTIEWSKNKDFVFKFSSLGEFFVLDQSFQLTTPLPFSALPSKCEAASTSTIYCFSPQEIPSGIIFPDDYLQKKFYSIDDLYKINLETDEIDRLLSSGEGGILPIDAKNPIFSNGKLFFINRYDGYLYQFEIK